MKTSKYFSLLVDCMSDISHEEQLSILIRCVEIDQNIIHIKEYFCGFLHINDSIGSRLAEVFINFFTKNDLDLNSCRGQSYDNGANMRGQYRGVQALIKERNPRAVYVPCYNHTVNLMVCDAAKSATYAITFLALCKEFLHFFLPQLLDGKYYQGFVR